MASPQFHRIAGAAAIGVAAGGILYSIFFVIFLASGSEAAVAVTFALLLVGGILASGVLIAVYDRVRESEPLLALWGLVLGLSGALGSAIHGGFDLANRFNEPKAFDQVTFDIPNPVDPRGLATFGLSGLGLIVLSFLILRSTVFPRRLGQLGILGGVLLVVVYLGRLTILNPKNPFLLTVAVASGVVVNPALFAWLGLTLRRSPP